MVLFWKTSKERGICGGGIILFFIDQHFLKSNIVLGRGFNNYAKLLSLNISINHLICILYASRSYYIWFQLLFDYTTHVFFLNDIDMDKFLFLMLYHVHKASVFEPNYFCFPGHWDRVGMHMDAYMECNFFFIIKSYNFFLWEKNNTHTQI